MIAPAREEGLPLPRLGFDFFPKAVERYELDSH